MVSDTPFSDEVATIKLREYTVSELSQVIKRTLEDAFSFVRVRGEISGLKLAPSGHVYFNLKDQEAILMSICWKGIASMLPFKLEEGLEVICTGKISIYQGRSTYQLIVNKIESAGLGALLAMLEKRKKKLEAEGLFDVNKKKPLPFLPETIGVITSPTGAVIRDILHRIHERFPVHVIIWPVLVQGAESAAQVASAIQGFNNLPNNITTPDLIIVARGGGSVEDLWPFNEEIVVRAVAASKIPIISAVGHETDTTLIDYASDKRAPTPTAAAEIAVPVLSELRHKIHHLKLRGKSSIFNYIKSNESKLYQYHNKIVHFVETVKKLEMKISHLHFLSKHNLIQLLSKKTLQIQVLAQKLNYQKILAEIDIKLQKAHKFHFIILSHFKHYISFTKSKLTMYGKLLESYHYKKVLKRGYALVWDTNNKIVSSFEIAKNKLNMDLEFHDGKVLVSNKKSYNKASKAPGNSPQHQLF